MAWHIHLPSVVLGVLTDVIGEVPLLLLSLDPVLVSAHVEEAFEGVLAASVVWVFGDFSKLLLRLLDVPEDVVWQSLENLVLCRC